MPNPPPENENPFATGHQPESPLPSKLSTHPGIENEPHLQNQFVPVDESEFEADRVLQREATASEAEAIEHTVWDEPALTAGRSEVVPDGELTYSRWLEREIPKISWGQSWGMTALVILAAGPWGVIGAIMSQGGAGAGINFSQFLMAVFIAPVTEEITKIAAALWIVEKRPQSFKSFGQILLCATAGGVMFGAIENVIYLTIYNPNHDAAYATWRWSVCTGLHVTCSLIAGIGLVRIWDNAIQNHQRPELALGMPWFAAAMIGHGLYNATVSVAEAAGWLSF